MIWPMANNQMRISTNPRAAAYAFRPREMKMMRTVLHVTTHVSARKITNGNQPETAEPMSGLTSPTLRQDRAPDRTGTGPWQDIGEAKRHTRGGKRRQGQAGCII